MERIGRSARLLLVQGVDAAERLAALFPERVDRIVPIPKSVLWMGNQPFDLRAEAGFERDDFLFLHAAGIRPVKRNLECLEALSLAHNERPRIRVVFAGPVLEGGYGNLFRAEVERQASFARWIPRIEPECMLSAYGSADAVLNTSSSEGLSNVILEAMAAGKPILASDVPGNRRLLDSQASAPLSRGLLFDVGDPEDFARRAVALADDAALRERLGKSGLDWAAAQAAPASEADALLRAYEAALGPA